MTIVNAPPPPSATASPGATDITPSNIPHLLTALSGEELRNRLDAAARKGRLPGLHLDAPNALFEIREFGHPFESALVASTADTPGSPTAAGVPQREIAFQVRIRPLIPTIFAIILILSIWPGIYLVDSMLRHYFSWYSIPTWWWYLPLTVPTSPWAFWSALKKSRASAHIDAAKLIQKVAAEIGANQLPLPPQAA